MVLWFSTTFGGFFYKAGRFMTLSKTILVVEDDHDTRVALRNSLEDEGYTVLSATNGRTGLEVLKANVLPSLILLDIMMPIMNGIDFLDAIKRDSCLSQIPVVVFSAFVSGKVRGASEVIKKPFELDKILNALKKFN